MSMVGSGSDMAISAAVNSRSQDLLHIKHVADFPTEALAFHAKAVGGFCEDVELEPVEGLRPAIDALVEIIPPIHRANVEERECGAKAGVHGSCRGRIGD